MIHRCLWDVFGMAMGCFGVIRACFLQVFKMSLCAATFHWQRRIENCKGLHEMTYNPLHQMQREVH